MREDTPNIADAGAPAIVVNENGASQVVLVCEHASRYIPAVLNSLGLDDAALRSHIAWDIGAEAVSRRLSRLLDAPLVLQRYSRLVHDCNRPPQSPDAIPEISEVTVVPGNRCLSDAERSARVEQIYKPFHDMVGAVLERRRASGPAPVLVTIHSFTSLYKGIERPFELGVLHDTGDALANAMLAAAAVRRDFETRRNQPYGPQDGVTHTLNLHANAKGLANVMLEIRNDLVAHGEGQATWADRLFELLSRALVAMQEAAGSGKAAVVR